MKRILKTHQAEIDLLDIAEYLQRDDLEVARRFLHAARDTFRQIAQMPGIGRPRGFVNPALADIRSYAVHGFRSHLVFYRSVAEGIQIVRVLHGARDFAAIFGEEDT